MEEVIWQKVEVEEEFQKYLKELQQGNISKKRYKKTRQGFQKHLEELDTRVKKRIEEILQDSTLEDEERKSFIQTHEDAFARRKKEILEKIAALEKANPWPEP